MAPWPTEVLDWCGVATHVHSTFPHNPTCSGDQSVAEVAEMALSLGLEGVAFAEHTTDPGSPTLGSEDLLEKIRLQAAATVAAGQMLGDEGHNMRLWSGVEANILPDGALDLPGHDLAGSVQYVVASQHGGLGAAEKDPGAIKQRLVAACHNDYVTTLGHPSRYNDEVTVDWPDIFAVAADTATAVEVNFNLWFSKGPGRGRKRVNNDHWFDQQVQFWETWTKHLAESGAPVVIGLDLHSVGMWPTTEPLESWSPTVGHLRELLELLGQAGLKPERVINSTAERFAAWLEVPKYDR